jgi:hypothetical protein
MIRPPRYGCPARTLRLRLLLVPQDETFSPGAISRPAPLPSVRGFFFPTLAHVGPTGLSPAGALILVLAQHLAGFQVDQMRAGASGALKRLIALIVVRHVIGRPALHGLAGDRAAKQKGCHHRPTNSTGGAAK